MPGIRKWVLLAFWLSCHVCAVPAGSTLPNENNHQPEVEVFLNPEKPEFSIRAENVTTAELLEALSAAALFELQNLVDSAGPKMTVNLQAAEWQEGLAYLLRGWNYALSLDKPTGFPKTLILIARDDNAVLENHVDLPGPVKNQGKIGSESRETSLEEARRLEDQVKRANPDPVDIAIESVNQAALDVRLQGESVEDNESGNQQYIDALKALENLQDPRLETPLVNALEAEDSNARTVALRALRNNPLDTGSRTLRTVYRLVTSDPDPIVRREALEVYVRYADEESALTLVQQLGREDGPARDIALREWIRIETERQETVNGDRQIEN